MKTLQMTGNQSAIVAQALRLYASETRKAADGSRALGGKALELAARFDALGASADDIAETVENLEGCPCGCDDV